MTRKEYALRILSLLDLTSLNETDTEETILELCKSANTKFGNTAAICIYPKFIKFAKAKLADLGASKIKIATVVNFPNGGIDFVQATKDTQEAIKNGANEIDVVIPYRSIKNNDLNPAKKLIKNVAGACKKKALLKVIIESGELQEPSLITKASQIAIESGANFIKTSTGKVPINATLQAADLMLNVIHNSESKCGFKAAGGIKTLEDAIEYVDMAIDIMGDKWVNPNNFRFGASSLLNNVLAILNDDETTTTTSNSRY